ncbi:MAG: metallophosphoesterase family protein [Desulfobacterales bacterium]
MKIALLSDIHGNHDALEAVLEDIAQAGAGEIFSLGDNIGYGGEPVRVMETLLARGISSVLGNHELAIRQPEHLGWFNPQARRSLERTRELLTAEALHVITALPEWRTVRGMRLVHGFPPDSALIYQFQVTESERDRIMDSMDEAICFIGHTHFPDLLTWDGHHSRRIDFQKGVVELKPGDRYIVNVGSVGQPRDGSNNAKYVVYDPDAATVELRHVPYDVESAVEKILEAGFPAQNAWRLR